MMLAKPAREMNSFAERAFSILSLAGLMHGAVLSIRRKQNQIINGVVLFVSVTMVYDFSWTKIATDMFLHYKAMFKNIIALLSSAWMSDADDKYVTVLVGDLPLPSEMIPPSSRFYATLPAPWRCPPSLRCWLAAAHAFIKVSSHLTHYGDSPQITQGYSCA